MITFQDRRVDRHINRKVSLDYQENNRITHAKQTRESKPDVYLIMISFNLDTQTSLEIDLIPHSVVCRRPSKDVCRKEKMRETEKRVYAHGHLTDRKHIPMASNEPVLVENDV